MSQLFDHKPSICVSLSETPSDELLQKAVESGVKIAEIRIDLFDERESGLFRDLIKKLSSFKTIVTIRSASEGGAWQGTDEERLALFGQLMPYVDMVDIELSSRTILTQVLALAASSNTQAIISYHDFDKTPPELDLKKNSFGGR